MNQDEGSYQLSHTWDCLLTADIRNWDSVLMKPQISEQNVVVVLHIAAVGIGRAEKLQCVQNTTACYALNIQ